MNRIFLSACAAALAFSGCRQSSNSTAHASVRGTEPTASRTPVVPAPKPTPSVPSTSVTSPSPVAVARPAPKPVAPVDPLALPHAKDGVDHLSRAEALRKKGDFKGALDEARRAIADQPKSTADLALLGHLARRTGQFDLAAKAYGRLARLEPTEPMPLVQQARALIEQKDFQGAEAAANEAVGIDDQCAEGFQALGRAYLSQGKLAQAITSFNEVVALVPEHGWALNDLGLAYLRSSQNQKALDALQKASVVLPNVAMVQNNLGLALERTGDSADAAIAYQRAIGLDPRYVKAHVNALRLGKKVASAKMLPQPSFDVAPADPELNDGASDDISGLRIQFQ